MVGRTKVEFNLASPLGGLPAEIGGIVHVLCRGLSERVKQLSEWLEGDIVTIEPGHENDPLFPRRPAPWRHV